jgi:hypothetical protein
MPHGNFPTPISIDPWHFALALCGWIELQGSSRPLPPKAVLAQAFMPEDDRIPCVRGPLTALLAATAFASDATQWRTCNERVL